MTNVLSTILFIIGLFGLDIMVDSLGPGNLALRCMLGFFGGASITWIFLASKLK